MPNNFFKYNLPYGIEKNSDNEWIAFNRDYLPLGYHEKITNNEIAKLPVFASYKGLTEKKLIELAWNPIEGVIRNNNNEIEKIFLYRDDNTNPAIINNDKTWNQYFERLKKLSILERKIL